MAMRVGRGPTEYDVVPYPSGARSSSHLDRLATPALLMGLQPAPINGCRVLELACGDGGNLIPMAISLPGSEFLGLDLAGSAIARGNDAIRDMGLGNVTLREADLMDAAGDLGKFDYVIAHGVYSWVPAAVRGRILAIARELMNPNGVAFVSYNAMPGGHFRQMIREMLRYHTRAIEDPAEKLAQGRALLALLAHAPGEPGDAYRMLMESEAGRTASGHDASLFHDDMAEINDPCYFSDFMEAASDHGLQFLAEADFFEMSIDFLPPDVRVVLARVASQDVVMKEQYLDFLKCRRFRQTLLCHQEAEINRSIDLERVRPFQFVSPAKEAIEPEATGDGARQFRHPNGSVLTTEDPLAHAAFRVLAECYPRQITFDDLVSRVAADLGAGGGPGLEPELLAEILFRAYTAGVIAFTLHDPAIAFTPGERPVASPWARRQAVAGEAITNLLHETVRVEGDTTRALLALLDGSMTAGELTLALAEKLPGDQPRPGEADVRKMIEALAALGLLSA